MLKRSVLVLITLLLVAARGLGQVSVTNANSFELDNGPEAITVFTPPLTPTPGTEVAGDGIVNGSPNDQMFYEILPRELMNASNGTAPGTLELVSIEVSLSHSFVGIAGGGTPPVLWDMSFHPVTYTNPVSGAANDGRRYPDLTQAPLFTIVGGPLALPPPTPCPSPAWVTYALAIELATAAQSSGLQLPATGSTDTAWCFWQPSGMSTLPADPAGCEVGGNLSLMSIISTNERVPSGFTAGGRNPLFGVRTSTTFDNTVSTHAFQAWPGFREPMLQFRFLSTTTVPNAMSGPERGSGAMVIDLSGADTATVGTRTCASGHLGELVLHFATGIPALFPKLPQPGFFLTPTAYLLLDWFDPYFFALTPLWDGFLVSNTTDYYFREKHTYDAPLNASFTGPFVPPGFEYLIQAFILNINVLPPYPVVSTNAARGRIY